MRMAAVQDALNTANARIVGLENQVNAIVHVNGELTRNQTESKARIVAVQKSVGSVNDKLGRLEREFDKAISAMDGLSGTLRVLPSDATVDEAREILAECLSSRFGAFGPVMMDELGLDLLIDEFRSDLAVGAGESAVNEAAAVRMMGIVFGCWKS